MASINAHFICSALKAEQFPPGNRPEIAFVGRSNVGKSSLLNKLLGRKDLAKTSSKPGKTQTINFFDVEGRWYFVDLPGYGYARVARSVKDEWSRRMLDYLRHRDSLKIVAVLLDVRHDPTENDLHMLELLEESEKPTLIIATKVDKLKRSQRDRQLKEIRGQLGLDQDGLIIPFSSETGEGVRQVWDIVRTML
ncbi:MAG TPA: ribosome biogenesis GTP-binding protein YihA/YsxC [Candidatus Hydrogenedentes bacterium]|jgi:GTP-binding protein|nr:MAG: putative GTP-binding protein EngB [Candidatus Hydrogenedentes bacterium ADurb.Bin170]HNZ49102.1 ribosome biogenesis GTP-binding protein YihA/YsxC [Candidatus Hydrogenedentota bacterium]HOD95927.1 ribosome biogenesis GTP-binding protein YihA/YsxC [Candidatus Hydrogenedentota bacterium]HOH42784.1 ribosome biogenesis GTP-binding protein YihA/YsxC [Candidatus Hydrogenedentota bacterium]HOM47552.1 ribosome biogenesis GTP-binding protein YihA/YsxC [Candidatus Hydrogenedentota bacterium]